MAALGLGLILGAGFPLRVHAQPGVPTLDNLAADWMPSSTVRSFPAFSNFNGTLKTTGNILGITHLSFAPYSLGSETLDLSVNGKQLSSSKTRWFPYQVMRQATVDGVQVETTTRMVFENDGVLLRIVLKNEGAQAQSLDLQADLLGNVRCYDKQTWPFFVPQPDTSGFQAALSDSDQVCVVRDTKSTGCSAFAFGTTPNALTISGNQGEAKWSISIPAGETRTLDIVMAVGGDATATSHQAQSWAAAFGDRFEEEKQLWEKRWQAAFTPKNDHFSGSAPILVTSDAKLSRVYYFGVLVALELDRTNLPLAPRVYATGSPKYAVTLEYFWDQSLWSSLSARLDPAMLRAKIKHYLALDYYNCYAFDFLSGGPSGPWYAANDLSLFTMIWNYITITGDWDLLNEKAGDRTVLEHMDRIAMHWKSLVQPNCQLADYGDASNLLECMPTYINEVPSLNAASVWIMRHMAEVHDRLGQTEKATQYRADAAKLATETLKLYIPGEGVWNCRHRDGSTVQLRHVYDYVTVGECLLLDLTPTMKTEMSGFVERELLVPGWMRALSLSDPAAPQSDRPDHGPLGAYDGWPAMTVATMCSFGQYDKALDLVRRCEDVTHEGSFSQSHELLPVPENGGGVVVPDQLSLNPTKALTVEAWIKVDKWAAEFWRGSIISKDRFDSLPYTGYILRCGENGKLSFAVATGNNWPEAISGAVMKTGQWCHVAGVFNGSTIQVYIDGTLQAATPVSGEITPSAGPLNIGRGMSVPDRAFAGAIKGVRIYDRALSASELAAQVALKGVYDASDTNGLVLSLPFNESAGTKAADEKASGPSGELVGNVKWVSGKQGSAIMCPGPDPNDVYPRIADRGLEDYFAICGASWASEAVLRGLFGCVTQADANAPLMLRDASIPRGFEGSLKGVRYHGDSYTITSDAHGLTLTKEQPSNP